MKKEKKNDVPKRHQQKENMRPNDKIAGGRPANITQQQ